MAARWAKSQNFVFLFAYNFADPWKVYGTSFLYGSSQSTHIGDEFASSTEITSAGIDVLTNLLPAEKVLTSVGKIKVLNAAEFNKL